MAIGLIVISLLAALLVFSAPLNPDAPAYDITKPASEQYHHIKEGLDSHGIHVEGVSLNLDRMMARKEDIVLQLTNGISALFKANGVEWLKGHGKLLADRAMSRLLKDDRPKRLDDLA